MEEGLLLVISIVLGFIEVVIIVYCVINSIRYRKQTEKMRKELRRKEDKDVRV